VLPLVLGGWSRPASGTEAEIAFRFQDPDIVESSGLVIVGDWAVTTNDSGDTGAVFTVDRGTGRTVGVTTWSDDPSDVEALAPAGPDEVWVGDIGDNSARREQITVAKVPIGPGDRTIDERSYALAYPDGPHNAESLLSDPTTGRLYVATKEFLGGSLYAVPESLDESAPNELTRVGDVGAIATDAAFFPDGAHIVVRKYGRAVVYEFPALTSVGAFELPRQQQGEGIAVAADSSIWVSSEGSRSPVWRLDLPEALQAKMAGSPTGTPSPTPTLTPTPSPSPSPDSGPAPESPDDPASSEVWPWVAGLLVFLAAGVVLLRSLRPRR